MQCKLFDDILGKFLRTYDIILLCETWTSADDDITLDGFEFYNFPRPSRHCNAKRNSGGLGVFVRDNIKNHVQFVKNHEDIITWFKLRKEYFKLPKDIYIGNVYIVPEGSSYLNADVFHLIKQDIAIFSNDAHVLICGDYNARTGVTSDTPTNTVYGNDNGLNQIVPNVCLSDHDKNIPDRYSMDNACKNSHGMKLLELCKSTGLLIFNGRLGSDKGKGEYTRIDTTGCSVVDYFIGSPSVFSMVANFCVQSKFPESDHRPVECSVRGITTSDYYDTNIPTATDWLPYVKYIWSHADLETIRTVLCDVQSQNYRSALVNAIVSKSSSDHLAGAFDDYIHQALERSCETRVTNMAARTRTGPQWYDRELRLKRSLAIKAGETMYNGTGNGDLLPHCRSMKQRKQREYRRKCLESIEYAYKHDRQSMWKVLKNINNEHKVSIEPHYDEFYLFFKTLSSTNDLIYFDEKYEHEAKLFLREYDNLGLTNLDSDIEQYIINQNFSTDEIKAVIDSLKNNKSPGIDAIPAEFIKNCKDILADDITMVLNYVVEERCFPDIWSEGLRSAVFKSGKYNLEKNYRGITILPIIEKIFEVAVYKRLTFANEPMGKVDRFNGGFIGGSRTSDNIFILRGLVQRQMIIGESLFVCFVDFSKAFDMVNRQILFYKIMKGGWTGRVIDTLRNLYSKTHYRVKRGGKLSPAIESLTGVNQGGAASGILFRKYLQDLDEYLKKDAGVCIGETLVAHLLWADDLVLFSNTEKGIQKQLNGLKRFCARKKMIVNEAKTKLMIFW